VLGIKWLARQDGHAMGELAPLAFAQLGRRERRDHHGADVGADAQAAAPRSTGAGTTIERKAVALDWSNGQVVWCHPLAPRFDAPPVPGGGLPRP
jgi:hypothetical protein